MRIYFDIVLDDESKLDDYRVLDYEFAAVRQISELLGKKVYNEGHCEYNALVCYVCVDNDEIAQMKQIVADNTGGGDDIVYLDNDFSAAQFVVVDRPGINRGEPLVEYGE